MFELWWHVKWPCNIEPTYLTPLFEFLNPSRNEYCWPSRTSVKHKHEIENVRKPTTMLMVYASFWYSICFSIVSHPTITLWCNWFSSHYSLLLLSNSIMRNHKIVLTIMLCTRIILLHSKSSICHEDRKYLGMPLIPSTLPLFLAKHLIYRFSCARNLLATSISSIIFIHDVLREFILIW